MTGAKKISSLLIPLLLVLALIAVCILSAFLPSFDASKTGVFKVSPESEKFLSSLDEEVEIHVISGGLYDSKFELFFEKYSECSDKIKLSFSTYAEAHSLLDEYGYSLNEAPSTYIVLIKSAKRAVPLDYGSMFYYDSPDFGHLSSTMYYNYYSLFASSESYAQNLASLVYNSKYCFYGDALTTAMIEYVTIDVVPIPYFITSHGEDSTTDGNFAKLMSAVGITYSTLELENMQSVPNDASVVIINQPKSDYTEREAELLISYLNDGGRLLMISSDDNADMPNLMTLAEHCGISIRKGTLTQIADEKETDSFNAAPNTDHDSIAEMTATTIKLVGVNEIKIKENTELRPSVLVTELLSVSADAQSSDRQTVAIAFEEETDGKSARAVWLTGAPSFNSSSVSEESLEVLYLSFNWLRQTYKSALGDIPATVYSEPLIPTSSGSIMLCGLFTVAVSVALIAVGAVIRYKRRKA